MTRDAPVARAVLLYLPVKLRLHALAILAALLAPGCSCDPPPLEDCVTDRDCVDDGAFCTGEPRCVSGFCQATPPCVTGQWCDEMANRCASCAELPDHPDCVDAGRFPPDAGLTCEDLNTGAGCGSASACGPSQCQVEEYFEWTSTITPDGLTGRPLVARAFPGGYCAATCDASRLNDECGGCAECSGEMLMGNIRLPFTYAGVRTDGEGACRAHCTPSETSSGCPREGYTCDPDTLTCMEACVDDQQCQITIRDVNGDGFPDFVDRGADFPAYCDTVTGRCRTRGRPGASIGDRCADDHECPDDAVCLFAEPASDGVCALPGCRSGAVTCPPGTVCDVRNVPAFTQSACLPGCTVGAEDGTGDVTGARAGHPQCGEGWSCSWNGTAEAAGPGSGSCVPGEYNSVSRPNVGQPCDTDDQCWSPFGYGECLFSNGGSFTGSCTVRHCATFLGEGGDEVDGLLPGVEITDPICDPARGEECVALGSRLASPQTYCLQRCEDASECADGYACPEILSGRYFCWPVCFVDSDCSAGSRCVSGGGVACGSGGDETCFCE